MRSYSVNEWIGVAGSGIPPVAVTFFKTGDFSKAGPSEIWILTEEHPWTIDDGSFEVPWGYGAEGGAWTDFPATRHGMKTPFGFGDGHVEMRKWVDPRTVAPAKAGVRLPEFVLAPGSEDLMWLARHTTVKTEYGETRP